MNDDKRVPAFRLPAGTCDAHCHVFGPPTRFPYSPGRKYEPVDTPKETLAALHTHLGISRAVIVQASAHGTDNRAMLDALAWRPNVYRGVAVIDDGFTVETLRHMHDAGVRGARFNFVRSLGGHPDPAIVSRVVDMIAPLGWHLVLHVKGDDLLQLETMIRGLPMPFVIDHMARVDVALGIDQPAFALLRDLLAEEECWVKVSGVERMAPHPYDAAVPFARTLVAERPDRVLWGTDYPHPNLPDRVDEADLVDMVPVIAPSAADQQRLLVDNPARLYGFPA